MRALLAILLLTAGCTGVVREPALAIPERPPIRFYLVTGSGMVCITEADGDKLEKWIDELDAFEAARQRLLKRD